MRAALLAGAVILAATGLLITVLLLIGLQDLVQTAAHVIDLLNHVRTNP